MITCIAITFGMEIAGCNMCGHRKQHNSILQSGTLDIDHMFKTFKILLQSSVTKVVVGRWQGNCAIVVQWSASIAKIINLSQAIAQYYQTITQQTSTIAQDSQTMDFWD